MHNTNSFTFTNYVKIYTQVQVQRLEIGWLEWVAPDSASTTSALSMTYSTPALLVRAGQGVFLFFFFFFFLGALGSAEAPMDIPGALADTSGAKPEASNISFLASSCASSSFLLWSSCSRLSNSPLTTDLRSHTCWHIFSHSFSALPASCARRSLLMTKIFHVLQHLLCLCHEGSGDGRTDRTTQSHRRRGLAKL